MKSMSRKLWMYVLSLELLLLYWQSLGLLFLPYNFLLNFCHLFSQVNLISYFHLISIIFLFIHKLRFIINQKISRIIITIIRAVYISWKISTWLAIKIKKIPMWSDILNSSPLDGEVINLKISIAMKNISVEGPLKCF